MLQALAVLVVAVCATIQLEAVELLDKVSLVAIQGQTPAVAGVVLQPLVQQVRFLLVALEEAERLQVLLVQRLTTLVVVVVVRDIQTRPVALAA
jgi:hypothetical protein